MVLGGFVSVLDLFPIIYYRICFTYNWSYGAFDFAYQGFNLF